MITEVTEELPPYPWFDQNVKCPFDPPPVFGRLRTEAPPTRIQMKMFGNDAWLITRYEDGRFVLGDSRFAADRRLPNFPHVGPPRTIFPGNFVHIDPPGHTRLRRMVSRGFTARLVEQLRPRIEAFTEQLIDDFTRDAQTADLKQALCLPLPIWVICELLGVPFSAKEYFPAVTALIQPKTSTPEGVRQTLATAFAHMGELVAEKKRHPGDDLISRLTEKYEAAGELSSEELVGISLALMLGAFETTSNMLSLAILLLLEHPEQLALLVADPTLARSAIEEVLRFITVVHTGLPRIATEDVVIGGRLIHAGEGVIVSLAAANRDGSVFPNPDQFDIQRFAGAGEERHHLAFGFGIKQCVGQMLARAQMQVVVTTLFRRLPDLRLAVPFEDVPFRHDMSLYGVHHLPVTW
jgi:cytochrome P450